MCSGVAARRAAGHAGVAGTSGDVDWAGPGTNGGDRPKAVSGKGGEDPVPVARPGGSGRGGRARVLLDRRGDALLPRSAPWRARGPAPHTRRAGTVRAVARSRGRPDPAGADCDVRPARRGSVSAARTTHRARRFGASGNGRRARRPGAPTTSSVRGEWVAERGGAPRLARRGARTARWGGGADLRSCRAHGCYLLLTRLLHANPPPGHLTGLLPVHHSP